MSLVYNKDFNFNGSSVVENENNEQVTLITMNASFQNGATLYVTKNIDNVELYTANKETADADYAEFEGNVLKAISDTATKTN